VPAGAEGRPPDTGPLEREVGPHTYLEATATTRRARGSSYAL